MVRPLLIVALLAAAAGPAAADGFYFLEGLGPSKYDDELGEHRGENGLNIRAALGHRTGLWAVEVWFKGELSAEGELTPSDGRYGGSTFLTNELVSYGVDLKRLHPISRRWSLYARGGLSRMIAQDAGYAGRGIGGTAGIQVAGKVPALGYLWWPLFFLAKDIGPKVHSGLWFEMSHHFYRLHGREGDTVDSHVTNWTLGFSVGQDF